MQHALKKCEQTGQVRTQHELPTSQVVPMHPVGCKDRSSLRGGEFVLSLEFLVVLRLCLWVPFEALQTIRELVLLDWARGVQQNDRGLTNVLCSFQGLRILNDFAEASYRLKSRNRTKQQLVRSSAIQISGLAPQRDSKLSGRSVFHVPKKVIIEI